MLIRRLPLAFRMPGAPFRIRRSFAIRGDAAKGYRVNFAYRSYREVQGRPLKALALRGDKHVFVEFDRRDIRILDVIDGGKVIGKLQVQGEWARFPHDERFRRAVCRASRDGKFARQHPLASYWAALTDRVDRPSVALQVFEWFQLQQITLPATAEQPNTVPTQRAVPTQKSESRVTEWEPWTAP